MDQKTRGLESLVVWQKALDFAVDVCQDVISLFPNDEKWALASQLRRSVQSIPANIAEGYGRYIFQETIHFCYIARGSMAETKTHLVLAHRLCYIDDQTHEKYQVRLSELGKMLNGYIAHLRNQKSLNSFHDSPQQDDIYEP